MRRRGRKSSQCRVRKKPRRWLLDLSSSSSANALLSRRRDRGGDRSEGTRARSHEDSRGGESFLSRGIPSQLGKVVNPLRKSSLYKPRHLLPSFWSSSATESPDFRRSYVFFSRASGRSRADATCNCCRRRRRRGVSSSVLFLAAAGSP